VPSRPPPPPPQGAGAAAAGGTAVGPATAPAPDLAPAAADARVIVATDPAEMIVTAGPPQFAPVPGAGGRLTYATNTASDLFLDQADRRYYVLLSGRWYAAASLDAPWAYVASDRLPPEFARIPADSPKADVRPFVAGTPEAREAVLDAGVPQTATIRRDAGAALAVAYDGDPQFADVPESPGVAYARNTPEDVLRVDGRYYCCHQAVWYESADPAGLWVVCTAVPPAIYTLPPTCPAYHCRYVSIYEVQPDYVICGYLPGYTGTFVYGPTIVYGTGYHYSGWYGTAYFPPPYTWGFAARYDPWASAWGFDAGLYWGPTWFAHPWRERWWRDHPQARWGTHRWWGPGGFTHLHNVRGHFADARLRGAYRFGGAAGLAARFPSTDHRGPGWHNLYARDGNAGRLVPADRLRAYEHARRADGPRDDVFAGHDGRAYRHAADGWDARRDGAARANAARAGVTRGGAGWVRTPRVPGGRPADGAIHAGALLRGGGGGTLAQSPAGLDAHAAARARGAFRAGAVQRSAGHVGGGARGGSFGGRGGGGSGGGHGGHR
jgi:hypothetical protein